MSAEFASFRAAAEKEASSLRSQLASVEAERERLAGAHADAAAHATALQQQLAEAQVHGTPKVGLGADRVSSRLSDVRARPSSCCQPPFRCSRLVCAPPAHHSRRATPPRRL